MMTRTERAVQLQPMKIETLRISDNDIHYYNELASGCNERGDL